MRRKISLPGILLVLAAAGLVWGIFAVIAQAGFQEVYLNDTAADNHGWEYEIRTASGKIKKVSPQYIDAYDPVLLQEDYNAVKKSRIMEERLIDASLELNYMLSGIEIFLDECLLYSDFQTDRRDADGFLLPDGLDIRDGWRHVSVNLPEDYTGKKLTMLIYYGKLTVERYPVHPFLQNPDTIFAGAVTDAVRPTLWLVFWGSMTLVLAVFCLIFMSGHQFSVKLFFLFLVYCVSFITYAYDSVMGYYSRLQEWIDQTVFRWLPVDIAVMEMILIVVCAVVLLLLEIWEKRKKQRKLPVGQTFVFGVISLFITAMQYSSELEGGALHYLPTIVSSISSGFFFPLVQMISSVIIYMITFLTIVQFAQWQMSEWKSKKRLLESSRFARENYELVMKVDEDSRRRNHEIRHHMQTLYSLLAAQETDAAKSYIEKVIKEEEQYAEMTYSENIVLNSIVGIRLNQAKKNGIEVQCHIHVPHKLKADDVDLSILLSNMLENALEACMRMEDRKNAYITLEVRKNQKFLFIECENSVDVKEYLKEGQTTVKADRKNHGFGLDAMKMVAEKYASIIQTERGPGSFTVRTSLCLPE